MNVSMSDDVRNQYHKAFQTLRGIVAVYPEGRWRESHGDDYYIPCRLAYHLAACITYHLLGGYRDKEYYGTLPYGRWRETKAEDLPDKTEFLVYLDGVLAKAEDALAALCDSDLAQPSEPERQWSGATGLGLHVYMMRELSAHTGELNKMLNEDGAEDIWVR